MSPVHRTYGSPKWAVAVATAIIATTLPVSAQDQPRTVVQSPAADRRLPWRFEQVWAAGGMADTLLGTDEAVLPGRIDVSAPGRVYVLQTGESRVVVLSGEDGSLVGTVGRRGRGPGELPDPVALAVSGDSVLAVYDWVQGFVRWRTPEMSLLPSVRTGAMWVSGVNLGASDAGFVYSETEHLPDVDNEGRSRQHIKRWLAEEQAVIMSGPERRDARYDVPRCGLGGMVEPRLFSPEMHWDSRDGRIVVADSRDYLLHVFDDMQPTMQVGRDIRPRQTNFEMARRETATRTWLAELDCEVSATEIVRLLGFEQHQPAVGGVAIAPDGKTWVLRGRLPDEPRIIDVFAADGSYLGTLPPDSPFPVAFVSADRILVAGRDDLNVSTLVSYMVLGGVLDRP